LGARPKFSPKKPGFDEEYLITDTNTGNYFVVHKGDQVIAFEPTDATGRQFLTEHLVDKAETWLDQRGSRPWFLYFATHVVHEPIKAKAELIQKYRDLGLPASGPDAANYAAMHEHMDTAIGRLLDSLQRRGLTENTIVIFLSDNGGREPHTVNSPYRGGKGELLEGGLRVPLIFQWPGHIAAGSANATPTVVEDLFPTLLDLTSITAPVDPSRIGVSLGPVLRGQAAPLPERHLYWPYPH